MIFGTIVLQVRIDWRRWISDNDTILSRWRPPWRHFTQNGAAIWWLHVQQHIRRSLGVDNQLTITRADSTSSKATRSGFSRGGRERIWILCRP